MALVHPRSGLAVKQGVTVLNAPGTIDAGYRGEIKVPLINPDPERAVTFHPGDRIAQLVIQRYVEAKFIEAQTLPGSDRAERGFDQPALRPDWDCDTQRPRDVSGRATRGRIHPSYGDARVL